MKRVRVLLAPGSKHVVVSSRAPFTVRDAAGKTHKLAAGKQELGPGLKLKLAARRKALPGAARLLARHRAARRSATAPTGARCESAAARRCAS